MRVHSAIHPGVLLTQSTPFLWSCSRLRPISNISMVFLDSPRNLSPVKIDKYAKILLRQDSTCGTCPLHPVTIQFSGVGCGWILKPRLKGDSRENKANSLLMGLRLLWLELHFP